MKKNRHPLKTPVVLRIVFYCVMAGLVGACFVIIRNRHVKKGDEIRAAEEALVEYAREIELWENRIAGLMDRGDLERRLRWAGSDLKEIDPTRVLKVGPTDELPALPKVAAR